MPLSLFFGPTEKISVICLPSFITKTRENKPYLQFLMKEFSLLHFESKCCESHLSLSVIRFVQTHPLTAAINNQMNSVFSMLLWIIYKVHSLSTGLNRNLVQCSVNGI